MKKQVSRNLWFELTIIPKRGGGGEVTCVRLWMYRSARTSGFFRSKGRVTIAWLMKTFISRCYVRNASSGVVVPYTAICVLSFYHSFLVHLRGTIICFRIAVVTCVAGDALALSCGADWLWTLCRLRVVAWTRHLGYNTLYHSGRLAYLFSSLEGPMNRC